MAEYGLQISDLVPNTVKLVPDHMTVISAGRVTMPNVLEGDNTYGVDIALPVTNVPLANLGVLVIPVTVHTETTFRRWTSGGNLLYNSHYGKNTVNYYTRNEANGVMTAFSCGALSSGVKNTWNPILSVYPIAFWDRMGQVNFDNIRLFAGTANCLRDTNNNTNFSLTSTPSFTGAAIAVEFPGYGDGTINNLIDDEEFLPLGGSPDEGSGVGSAVGGFLLPDGEASSSCILQVEFASAKTIEQVTINYIFDVGDGAWPDGVATQGCIISIYVDSAWLQIYSMSYSGDYYGANTVYAYGNWRNVTKIRAAISNHIHAGPTHSDTLWSNFWVGELAGWGPDNDDSVENKLVYSIGDKGVEEVDYLICMKDYNP